MKFAMPIKLFCLTLTCIFSLSGILFAEEDSEMKSRLLKTLSWEQYRFELWQEEASDNENPNETPDVRSQTLKIFYQDKLLHTANGRMVDADIATDKKALAKNRIISLFSASPELLSHSSFTDIASPEILITDFSGGAHCCFAQTLIRLKDGIEKIELPSAKHDTGQFLDIDHKSPMEFLVSDGSYAYWPDDFATSPFPDTIYQYDKTCDCYQPSLDLTQKINTSDAEKLSKEIKKNILQESVDWDDLKPRMYKLVLISAYSGYWERARTRLLRYWSKSKTNPTATEIWNDVICRMQTSEFVKKTKMLNKAPVEFIEDVTCPKE